MGNLKEKNFKILKCLLLVNLLLIVNILNVLAQESDLPFQGKIIKELEYSGSYKPYQGKRFIRNTSKKWHLYDDNMVLVKAYEEPDIRFKGVNGIVYTESSAFEKGKYVNKESFGFIDEDLELVIPCKYKSIELKYQWDYLAATSFEDIVTIFDFSGNEILTLPKGYQLVIPEILDDPIVYSRLDSNGEEYMGIMNFKQEVLFEEASSEVKIDPNSIYKDTFIWGKLKDNYVRNFNGDTIATSEAYMKYLTNGIYGSYDTIKAAWQLIDEQNKELTEAKYNTPSLINGFIRLTVKGTEKEGSTVILNTSTLQIEHQTFKAKYHKSLDAIVCEESIFGYNRDSSTIKYFKEGKVYDKKDFYKNFVNNQFGVLPFQKHSNRKWGLADAQMNMLVKPKYYYMSSIKSDLGLLVVSDRYKKDQFGVINTKGEEVLAVDSQDIYIADKGLIVTYQKKKHCKKAYEILNREGKSIIPPIFNVYNFKLFKDGMMAVKLYEDDETVEQYKNLSADLEKAKANFEEGWQYLSSDGKLLFKGSLKMVGPFVDDIAIVETHKEEKILINKKGERLNIDLDLDTFRKELRNQRVANPFKTTEEISANEVNVSTNDFGLVYINPDNEAIELPSYINKTLLEYDEYFLICKSFKGFQLYDPEERKLLAKTYYTRIPSKDKTSLSIVKQMKKQGVVDANGEIVLPLIFTHISLLDNGRAIVYYNEKKYLLDLKNQ